MIFYLLLVGGLFLNLYSNNYSDNYEKMLNKIIVKYNQLKLEINKLIIEKSIDISYKCIYFYSLCQIEYNRVHNIISPVVIPLWKSLIKYLKDKNTDFVSLIDKSHGIINYLNEVLILDDCKDIDNISKIEKSFIKNGVDPVLDNKIKTLMDSQDQLEACRLYFSSLISNYEVVSKSKKTTKKKVVSTSVQEEEEGEEKEYVNIHETEKNNFSLLATERRCKILDEIIKNNKSVKLTYNSSFSGVKTEFTLSLELEYNKQSQSKKSITNSQINGFCKNVGLIKVNLIDTVSKVKRCKSIKMN